MIQTKQTILMRLTLDVEMDLSLDNEGKELEYLDKISNDIERTIKNKTKYDIKLNSLDVEEAYLQKTLIKTIT